MGYLVYRLGLLPLVGFLLAGLGLGALGFSATPALEIASEVGVTLLLFTIGLKLNIRSLTRPEVWAGGTLHMVLTVLTFSGVLFALSLSGIHFFLGIDFQIALLLSFALSFSSTVFAVKILDESDRTHSLNGRTAIGILIIQDMVAVIYMTFSTGKLPSLWALLVIALLPVAGWVFRRILGFVGHGELMVLMGLFLALIAGAHSFEQVALKPDSGSLILGMLMAPHPRAKEMADALMSIKDILLVGFFLTIGLTGLPNVSGFVAAGILVLLLPLKMMLYFVILTRFKFRARTAFMTTMNLVNYSEFGLIVGAMAVANEQLNPQWLVVMAIALSVSMILAAPLNRHGDRLFTYGAGFFRRFESRSWHREERPFQTQPWEIMILGMGRVGTGAYDWFHSKFGSKVSSLDFDADTVRKQRERGRSINEADVTDPDFWRRVPAPLGKVRLVVLALSNAEAMLYAAKMLRQIGYKGKVAAVARYDDEVKALREAGVNTAFNIYGEAGAGLAAHTFESVGPDNGNFNELSDYSS